jgi:poly-gamma-glutamate capsule biosynthesis protein CapA/YwtB (metallophosphatase superfamily)
MKRHLVRCVAVAGALVAGLGCAPGFGEASPTQDKLESASARDVTLSAVGDMIFGNTPSLAPNPAHYLDAVDGAITGGAQIVFANLEGTLTTRTKSKCPPKSTDCFAFRNPPHFAKYFAADGFTVLNDANNHSYDFGEAGQQQTVNAIHAAGMAQTGLPGEITVVQAGGHKVALVAFAPYSYDASLLDLKGAAALIQQAKTEAQVVVVYLHAGAEGSAETHVTGHEEYAFGEDRGNPEKFAHLAVRDGASLVIASGPHVLRGMEFYRGHLIAYSLGNFANFHNFGGGGVLSDSGILHVRLGPKGGFVSARLRSVLLDSEGHPTLGGSSVAIVRALSQEDFGAHAVRLSDSGAIRRPK